MPNHIQNRIQIVGPKERVAEIFNLLKGDDCQIDFDKIIPCPQVIKDVGEIHSGIETAVKAVMGAPLDKNPLLAALQARSRENVTLNDDDRPAYDRALKAYQETGYAYWYDWNVDHWGTKWNAYGQNDQRNTEDTIFFETAWSFPEPIVRRLAQIFTDVEILWDYADEDSGSNTGKIICRNGRVYLSKLENQSKEAYDLYFELHPGRIKDYVLVGDTYEYKED